MAWHRPTDSLMPRSKTVLCSLELSRAALSLPVQTDTRVSWERNEMTTAHPKHNMFPAGLCLFNRQSQVNGVTCTLCLESSHLIERQRFGNLSCASRTPGLVCVDSWGLKLAPRIIPHGSSKAEGSSLEISCGGRYIEMQIQESGSYLAS